MKNKTKYVCQSCSFITVQWIGRCPDCGDWNSFIVETENKVLNLQSNKEDPSVVVSLKNVILTREKRFSSGSFEFDRVLGGGVVYNSLNLIGGEPGVGKSTLLLQLAAKLSESYNEKVIYFSGEESLSQIGMRAKRLNIQSENILLTHKSYWEEIKQDIVKYKAKFIIIDSIQTTTISDLCSSAGSVSQVKEVTHEILNFIKSNSITAFIVSHINKSGSIAGPKVLEHMVDTVLYFEGEKDNSIRFLRCIKNRYGALNEIGIFTMNKKGLSDSKQSLNLLKAEKELTGRSTASIYEGSRQVFVEVQALVLENKLGNARRYCHGVDHNRLAVLLAVIEKFLKIKISNNDIYINFIGIGLSKSRDTDLAIIISILSSFYNIKVSCKKLFIGEIGLNGEIRSALNIKNRIKESSKIGFEEIIVANNDGIENQLNVVNILTINQLVNTVFSNKLN